jgi:hypothetical protein
MNDLFFFFNFVFALILNDASSISTNGASIRYIEQMLECYTLCFHLLRDCGIIMGMRCCGWDNYLMQFYKNFQLVY